MALIKCPECGKEVSDRSHTCIQCGFPIYEYVQEQKELDASMPHCFNCNSTNINPRGFCNNCGAKQEKEIDPDVCPKCGTKLDSKLRVCPKCWYRERDDYEKSYMICPNCGNKNPLGKYICNHCGYNYKLGDLEKSVHAPEMENTKKEIIQPKTESNITIQKTITTKNKKKKRGYCGTILWAIIIMGIASSIFESDNEDSDNKNVSVWSQEYTEIEEFEYYTDGNELHITEYNGNDESVNIAPTYVINNIKYNVVSLESATFIFSDAKSIIIPAGVKHLDDNTFNSCDVKYLFLPATLTNIEETFWHYFHDLDKLYYGGDAEKFNKICTLNRDELEIKEIFLEVQASELGTDSAEEVKYDLEITIEESQKENYKEKQGTHQDVLSSYMTESRITQLNSIFKTQIGFEDLKFVGRLGETLNYQFEADGYDIVVTDTSDDFRIFIPNSGIVLYENGSVVMSIKDLKERTIEHGDMYSYYIMAKMIVEDSLVNPRTAKFPSVNTNPEAVSMSKNGDLVVVQSYVDSQNAFGATVRNDWTVQYTVIDMDSYLCDPNYIKIGEESSGTYLSMD